MISDIRKAGKELLKYPNVVGYSNTLQKRIRKNMVVDEDVIRVYVTKKIPREQLKPSEIIPPEIEIDGVRLKTDVVEIGKIRKLEGYKERYRPSPCGVSTGRADETSAGTIGWWIFDENGNIYMISNNHVWAKENQGSPGDLILQPGRADGGDPEKDVIARLVDYVPISWTGVNKVDVAVAQADDLSKVYMSIMETGGIIGKVTANPGQVAVRKVGRSTGLTQGVLSDWSATLYVEYDNGVALFTDVFLASGSGIVKPGDSGSPVIDPDNKLVGLVFAGNGDGSLLVGCKAVNIETELSQRMNRRIYTLLSNSYPPFRVETKVQVVHPPIFWSLLMSSILTIMVISAYDMVKSGSE